jgi:glycerophosphoryl diester phosphodiesterase
VDTLGEQWAKGKMIPIKRFPADWRTYGKQAGPRRNEDMARYADQLIAVWDGVSPGTRNMIWRARRYGLTVFVFTYGEPS